MSWNSPGGGPWGSGQGPWGHGPTGGGPPTLDLEELLRRSQDRFRHFLPGGTNSSRSIIVLIFLVVTVWGMSGFYRVQTDEQGVVMIFGRHVDDVGPGLHYNLPTPVGAVYKPKVTIENQVEIGYRSEQRGRLTSPRDVSEESLMLTGDENTVDIDFTVIWDVKDAAAFLFNIRDPGNTVRVAAESAMREVIGQTPIQVAMTEGRDVIEQRSLETLQRLLDQYQAGIRIKRVQLAKVDPPTEVVDAFNDVQRAKADRERLRNEAEAYRNSIIPTARGDAERLVQEAQAYREEVVNRAQGDASRFLAVLSAYVINREVTERRLYYETMENLLRGAAGKIVVDGAGAQGVLPYLPLTEIGKTSKHFGSVSPSTGSRSGDGRR
ncbi:HflK protein [invertebrate metagenome]|uniref:HflK protein n=1 Tax=invertebrate metagenome TaxID=1711999 RepID=A0A484HD91_9ZZZZ